MDFSQIFKTVDTIAPGLGSGIFTPAHLSVLFLEAVVGFFLVRRFLRSERAGRERILSGVALFVVTNEILKDIYLYALGDLGWKHLPLHLCGINVITISIYWLTKSKKMAEWLYCMSLPGGLVALLSPDWAELPVINIMFWQTNTIHTALVLFPILLLADGFKPDVLRAVRITPWFLALAAIIYPLNKVLHTNFLFMNWAPIGTPFEAFETWLGNPGYLLAFCALLLLTWFLMYLPWRKKRSMVEEEA